LSGAKGRTQAVQAAQRSVVHLITGAARARQPAPADDWAAATQVAQLPRKIGKRNNRGSVIDGPTGDGEANVVVSSYAKTDLGVSLGNGSFSGPILTRIPAGPEFPATGDSNGDSNLDLDDRTAHGSTVPPHFP
jgi:hypothetical protein